MLLESIADDDDPDGEPAAALEPRTRVLRVVYGCKDSESGDLIIIPPEESLWYKMYVPNYYLLENAWMKEKFRVRFCLPYKNYRELV